MNEVEQGISDLCNLVTKLRDEKIELEAENARIKAERGEAVELLRRIGEGPLIDGKIDVEVDVFNASIKEQNEKAKAKAGT